jgi:hypothetical protein
LFFFEKRTKKLLFIAPFVLDHASDAIVMSSEFQVRFPCP